MRTTRRYSITHPVLTPELYPATPHDGVPKVRALHIPQFRPVSPEVICDRPQHIKEQVFDTLRTSCLHFNNGFHMYIATISQGIYMFGENIVATQLMRQHRLVDHGVMIPDTIFGDALIFGSSLVYYRHLDNFDYSVPYELVEQILHLFINI